MVGRVGVVLGFAVVATLFSGSAAAATTDSAAPVIVVARGLPPVAVTVTAGRAGEAVLTLMADAPGVSWAVSGRESAVVSVDVDGHYVSDLVVFSARPTPREVALGALSTGRHTVRFRFAADRSAPSAHLVRLAGLRLSLAAQNQTAIVRRHAPVLIGRSLAQFGGPTQNARTDTPLLAWHEAVDGPVEGQRRLTYSVVWSNEDGGTDSPGLMARWGRTTDIEWVYSVVVDAHGQRVPDQAFYHGPNHQKLAFAGRYEGDHPLLQTCSDYNSMCDVLTGATMRFALPADETRPIRRAREYLMDVHPWSYRVMAEEMLREGKVEDPSDPATPAMGDHRTYLYLEVDKDTGSPPESGTAPGVSIVVRLRGDPADYRSDHAQASWAIARDDPAATTVELPSGVGRDDIERIDVIRVPLGTEDNGAPITVTDLNRAFFLDSNWRPDSSFAESHGLSLRLDPSTPTATIWKGSI